jgi:hypothetical protein
MEDEPRNAAIVRSTVDLGRNLGLEVIAEGVETETAYNELARLGCNYAQGYLLARPMPASELTPRLSELERERAAASAPAHAANGDRPNGSAVASPNGEVPNGSAARVSNGHHNASGAPAEAATQDERPPLRAVESS